MYGGGVGVFRGDVVRQGRALLAALVPVDVARLQRAEGPQPSSCGLHAKHTGTHRAHATLRVNALLPPAMCKHRQILG